jgi:hypothetical protein
VAERAGDADAHERVAPVDRLHVSLHADDGVELQEGERRGRAVQVDLAGGDGILHRLRERVGVHSQADGQRDRRRHRLLDDLVHAERVGPELLVAEGVEAEDLPPALQHLGARAGGPVVAAGGDRGGAQRRRDRSRQREGAATHRPAPPASFWSRLSAASMCAWKAGATFSTSAFSSAF